MVHVGELDAVQAARVLRRVNQDVLVAPDELLPLEIGRDLLGGLEHVGVQGAHLLGLPAGESVESLHGLLDGADNVRLKDLEVGLHGDQVVAVIVLLHDLVAEPVDNSTADDVRVVVGGGLAARRLERGRVLAQKLDVLLRLVACHLDLFGAFLRAPRELLTLVFDLLMKPLDDGEDGPLDALLRLQVGVDQRLRVDAHVLEEAGDATEALVEVVAILERLGDALEIWRRQV